MGRNFGADGVRGETTVAVEKKFSNPGENFFLPPP